MIKCVCEMKSQEWKPVLLIKFCFLQRTAAKWSPLHSYCVTFYNFFLYNYYFGCFLDKPAARRAHLVANMKRAGICSVGAVKDDMARRGKGKSCVTAGGSEGAVCKGKDIFCSCQVYLYWQRTLAVIDKTKDNTTIELAYFIYIKGSRYIL